MKALTFPGGIHPEYHKDISISEPVREAPLPKVAVVPLSQHIGAPNKPLVAKGDTVEEGQLLGKVDSFVSAPVHSPVFGTVTDIKKAFHPAIGPVMSVFIQRDETKGRKKYTEQDVEAFSPQDIIEKVKNAGVVGMGGAAFPTYVKLSAKESKKEIDTLIINGAECEPYLTCDHIIMTRKPQEILKGIELIMQVLEPKNVYIAIEENKKAALFSFQKAIRESTHKPISKIRVVPLKTKYPQGGEKQLIKAISGKEVPPGGLPLDIGFLIQNAATVYAVYEAVYFNRPLIERMVTISGDCLERAGNYLIRVGTTLKEIMESYGLEFAHQPRKIIMGGPMMGVAQPQTDVPVIKGTSGILFLSEKASRVFEEGPCVRCAKCVDVCPVRLLPTEIMRNVKKQRWEDAEKLYVADCMECGSCMYECPARIPLVQYIKEGKAAAAGRK